MSNLTEANLENRIRSFREIVDQKYDYMCECYLSTSVPLQVNFRDLVSWVPYSDSETHYIHPYPAKLIKHIPIFFLNSSKTLSRNGAVVLDPFCGSGTVLLEALLNGYDCIGADANPLARLISRVKTTPLNSDITRNFVSKIVYEYKKNRAKSVPNVVNVDHWYSPKIKSGLVRLKSSISKVVDEHSYTEFFELCFSATAKELSYSDPAFNVPVKIKPEKFRNEDLRKRALNRLRFVEQSDVLSVFLKKVEENTARVDSLGERFRGNRLIKLMMDAKNLDIEDESVDLIITSPPYSGAQKYIRSSSLSLGWLGYCEEKNLKDFEDQNIGREHYKKSEYTSLLRLGINDADSALAEIWKRNPLRAHINAAYLSEMKVAISEMFRVLKVGSKCVLVVANNQVCGRLFETQNFLTQVAIQCGFHIELKLIDNIHSRGLMTKRNKTAGVINSEWIIVMRKP